MDPSSTPQTQITPLSPTPPVQPTPIQQLHTRRWIVITAIIIVLIALGLGAFFLFHNAKVPTQTTATTANAKTQRASTAQASGSSAQGTDDSSLDNSLDSVSGAMNRENTDQSSATNALNDQSQEISVPTS